MNNDTKSGGGKVFDIMRPGSVPAEPTSRPVINTTHGKPAVPDDQFVSTDAVNPRPTLDKHNRISISPIEKEPEEPLHSLAAWTDEENDTPPHQIATAATPETRVQPDADAPTESTDSTTESTESNPAEDVNDQTQSTSEPSETPEEEPLSVDEDKPEELQPVVEPPVIAPTPPPTTEEPVAFPGTQVVGNMLASNVPPSELLVSHHSKPMGKLFWAGIVLLAIVISLVAINFLLDANILPATHLPHTNLI